MSDLQAGLTDPPLYISTNDDYISFAKCADNLDTFLLSMLWDAAYGYNGGVRLTDSVQIDAVLDQAGIDRKLLEFRGLLSACLDDKGETLYIHYSNGQHQELITANRNKPAPQTKPVFEMPTRKYVPRGPYHIDLTFDQGITPANSTHIHPLIARVIERMYGKRLLVHYDWMKAIGKTKGLTLD